MKNIECQKGAKVICQARYDVQYNSVGIIIDVVRNSYGEVIRYWVQDVRAPSSGFPTVEWSYLESWDLVVESAQTKRSSDLATPRKTLTLECPCGIFRARCDYHRIP
jgi:hypothetical protein